MTSLTSRVSNRLRRELRQRTTFLRNPLTASVVGCGQIAGRHIEGYLESGLVQVRAVSDISAVALAKANDQWPMVSTYRNLTQMLGEIRPDVVSICTWPQHHADLVDVVANAGVKGILCEKPIALRMDHINRMIEVCNEQGVKLGVGHQYRFHPVFVQARTLVQKHRIGQVQRVTGRIRGSVANNGPHLADTVRFLLDDIDAEEVSSRCERTLGLVERGIPCEESAVSQVVFDGGIECELFTGEKDGRAFEISIFGSGGTITVTPDSIELDGRNEPFSRVDTAKQGRRRQFREFVDWVRGRSDSYAADGNAARASAEMCLAFYESARLGETVKLPLANDGDVIHDLYPSDVDEPPSSSEDLPIDGRPTASRMAMDGGRRALSSWPQNRPAIGIAEIKNLVNVILSGNLNSNGGKMVLDCEQKIAAMYGAEDAVASSSGTAALHVALAAINPEPLDEVITTPLTDMGSVIPILACNCVPVFADVDPQTGNLTAESIRAKITSRTKAVILVHLFGLPADLDEILAVTREAGVALIEDCSQAHFAEYKGTKVGTFGDFGCFSLQQSKQITCGDGGLTLVNDPDLAQRARLFVDKGWDRKSASRLHPILRDELSNDGITGGSRAGTIGEAAPTGCRTANCSRAVVFTAIGHAWNQDAWHE